MRREAQQERLHPLLARHLKVDVDGVVAVVVTHEHPDHVTPGVIADKHAITRQNGGRFGTAAFVTGGLDPVESRQAFLALFAEPISGPLPPVSLLRPQAAPRRSGAEMDALAAHLGGAGSVPGALSPHEEYPEAVAEAIRAEVGRAI